VYSKIILLLQKLINFQSNDVIFKTTPFKHIKSIPKVGLWNGPALQLLEASQGPTHIVSEMHLWVNRSK